MGILDSDESAVKNHMMYKNMVESMKNLENELQSFKSKGGTSSVVSPLAQACKRAFRDCDKGEKQFPNLKDWAEQRKTALEIARALVEKFKDHPALESTDLVKAAADPNFRYQ